MALFAEADPTLSLSVGHIYSTVLTDAHSVVIMYVCCTYMPLCGHATGPISGRALIQHRLTGCVLQGPWAKTQKKAVEINHRVASVFKVSTLNCDIPRGRSR